ncbi:MAG: protoporphyrinogen oxidase [Acidobacteria bacterium]|nr:protoporphyrinogen oxidase [Acidobacteriota bacterium]
MAPVAIVGGGISGLSAAYFLSRAGTRAIIIEKDSRLGGVIRTDRVDGCLVEAGPDSFLAAKPEAMELIRELGLESDVISSNDHRRVTYILKNGRLVPLPDGLMMMVPTRLGPMAMSPLLGWGTKVRMGLDYFRRPSASTSKDEPVSTFVRRHYGQEAVDYLAEPLLAGVYGGDPEKLSVASVLPRFVDMERTHGSLTRGVLAARSGQSGQGGGSLFRTLKGGVQQLTDALIERTQPKTLAAGAETLERAGTGFRLRVGRQWMEAARVILAVPAWCAAGIVRALDPELAALLDTIPYASSMTAALGYRTGELGHSQNGFGFLVPKRERQRMVACTWVGTKFDHRVPPEMALLRCFLPLAPDSDEAVIAHVREELRRIMGIAAAPVFARVSRWPRAMAQYHVGHAERVKAIEARVAAIPGLRLIGNGYHGIGIPDCIKLARRAAGGETGPLQSRASGS